MKFNSQVQSLIPSPMRETSGDGPIPTTKEIVEYLDKFVIGQEGVKKAVAVTTVKHLVSCKFNIALRYSQFMEDTKQDIGAYISPIYNPITTEVTSKIDYHYPIKKHNLLIIGPSGSGKTLIVKKLAEFLNVPFYIGDATSLTAAGYVGNSVDSLLSGLYRAAEGHLSAAERGIIFIDEVDKISKKDSSDRLDVGGLEVQNALLTFLEGGVVHFEDTFSRKGAGPQEQIEIDTENILFIVGGAFTDLRESLDKKSKMSLAGFNTEPNNKKYQITIKDMIDHGMTTEFVGRITGMAETEVLTKDVLQRIMVEPEDSIIKQYKVIFDLMGKKWYSKSKEAKLIKDVVDRAVDTKTGARSLGNILEEKVRGDLYE